ncbi:hypothetical protein A3Q56_07082, partial [Intoshia linei]
WECKADLNNIVKFGTLDVNCEGYDYPEDPYILVNSCRLLYSLHRIDGRKSETSNGESFLPILFIIGLIILVYYVFLRPNPNEGARHDDGYGGNYGGGDSGGAAPPPPPYNKRSNNQGTGGFFSNFWSGAMMGGAAGYLFGNRGHQNRGYSSYGSQYNSPYPDYNSGPSTSGGNSSYQTGYASTSRR